MAKGRRKLVLGVGVLAVLLVEIVLRNVFITQGSGEVDVAAALVVEWVLLAVLLFLWVPRVEGETRESFGAAKPRRRHLLVGVLAFVLIMVALAFNSLLLDVLGLEGLRSMQTKIGEFGPATLVGLFLTGTFLEEVLYRGYIIERLTSVTGRMWSAGFVSWVGFTFVHLGFFGLGPTLDVGVISAGLVLLYLKERSIWPCIVAHGINNTIAYLIPLLSSA
jgi:membrane protease YdiL (CAAX protease family)